MPITNDSLRMLNETLSGQAQRAQGWSVQAMQAHQLEADLERQRMEMSLAPQRMKIEQQDAHLRQLEAQAGFDQREHQMKLQDRDAEMADVRLRVQLKESLSRLSIEELDASLRHLMGMADLERGQESTALHSRALDQADRDTTIQAAREMFEQSRMVVNTLQNTLDSNNNSIANTTAGIDELQRDRVMALERVKTTLGEYVAGQETIGSSMRSLDKPFQVVYDFARSNPNNRNLTMDQFADDFIESVMKKKELEGAADWQEAARESYIDMVVGQARYARGDAQELLARYSAEISQGHQEEAERTRMEIFGLAHLTGSKLRFREKAGGRPNAAAIKAMQEQAFGVAASAVGLMSAQYFDQMGKANEEIAVARERLQDLRERQTDTTDFLFEEQEKLTQLALSPETFLFSSSAIGTDKDRAENLMRVAVGVRPRLDYRVHLEGPDDVVAIVPELGDYSEEIYSLGETMEGGLFTKGYVPTHRDGRVIHNSGVTIGWGVDLGQQSVSKLKSLGVSEELIGKLKPYIGRQKDPARDYAYKHPLQLEREEAIELSALIVKDHIQELAKEIGPEKWGALPTEFRSVILSLDYHLGPGGRRRDGKGVVDALLGGDHERAIERLKIMAKGDTRYHGRRTKEIELLREYSSQGDN